MTPDQAVLIVRQYHAAIDRLDFEAIAQFFADDAVYISGGVGGTIHGREPIMAAFSSYFSEFPDQVSVDNSVESLSAFEVRSVWQLKATSRKTGDTVRRGGEEVVTLDGAGKIVRVEVNERT